MNKNREIALQRYLDITERMYKLLGVNTPNVGVNYQGVAQAIEAPPWMLINVKVLLEEDLKALETKITYNPTIDGVRKMGRHATWTLVKPFEEVKQAIIEWEKKGEPFDYEKRSTYVVKSPVKKNPVVEAEAPAAVEAVATESFAAMQEPPIAIAKTEKEETRAIAGPEPEKTFASLAVLRKDEPRALVEAAKQYANRQTAVEKEYQSLVTMGLNVDREKFFEAISLPRDEFMEHISLVLPLITELQNKNDHLLDQLNAARDKVKGYAELKGNYERLQKLWNQRVADKVKAS